MIPEGFYVWVKSGKHKCDYPSLVSRGEWGECRISVGNFVGITGSYPSSHIALS